MPFGGLEQCACKQSDLGPQAKSIRIRLHTHCNPAKLCNLRLLSCCVCCSYAVGLVGEPNRVSTSRNGRPHECAPCLPYSTIRSLFWSCRRCVSSETPLSFCLGRLIAMNGSGNPP